MQTGAEAARGAGIDSFGAMRSIMLCDIDFAEPAFSYSKGVAQAVYTNDSATLVVRKAQGSANAPMTDENLADLPSEWTQDSGGYSVKLNGADDNGATVAQWSDGSTSYSATVKGAGDSYVAFTYEDIDDLVYNYMKADSSAVKATRELPGDASGSAASESAESAGSASASASSASASASSASSSSSNASSRSAAASSAGGNGGDDYEYYYDDDDYYYDDEDEDYYYDDEEYYEDDSYYDDEDEDYYYDEEEDYYDDEEYYEDDSYYDDEEEYEEY